MLVLSRCRDQSIMIGEEVEVTIVCIRGDRVRLGITAPKRIPVHRREVYNAIHDKAGNGNRKDSSGSFKGRNQCKNKGENNEDQC